MNRMPVQMPAMDEKQAMRRIAREMVRSSWMSLALLPALMITGLRGDLGHHQFLVLFFVAVHISVSRSNFSQRALRMLPVSRRSLATTLWRFAAGYPVILIAEVSVINALYSTYAGDAWGDAWGNAAHSFSWFLFIDAVPVAAAALGIVGRREDTVRDKAVVSPWTTRVDWIEVLNLLSRMLFVMWILFFPEFYSGPHAKIMAFNLVIGGAAFAAAYLFRDGLVTEFARSAEQRAQRTESGLVWATSGRDTWWLALLKHMSGTAVWSACISGVVVAACMTVIEFPRDHAFEVDTLIGIVVGAAILSFCLAWIPWNIELRAWRMLPINRVRLGAAISGFMVAASILPWTLTFMTVGLVALAKECLSFDGLFSLLGMSIVIQGALLTILPSILRGSGRGVVLVIVSAGSAIYCMFYSSTLLANIKQLSQSELTVHGAVWMTAGMVVLCAGMVLSAWHAERVLRHGDCYRKAGE